MARATGGRTAIPASAQSPRVEGVEVWTANFIEHHAFGIENAAGGQGRQGILQFREPAGGVATFTQAHRGVARARQQAISVEFLRVAPSVLR